MSSKQLADHLARQMSRLAAAYPAIRRGPAADDESGLHEAIVAECRVRGWAVIHSRMDRKATCTVGSPDFVILASEGRTIYVEAKARNRKRTTAQLAFAAHASKLGHTVHLVNNLEEFMRVCQ